MHPRHSILFISLFAALCLSLAQRPARAGERDELDALVALALERNPELEAIEEQIQALEHRADKARAWKDPRLTLAYQNVPTDSFLLGREPMSMATIRLEQTIPWFGKTKKRGAVASQAAKSERWALAERKVQLRALVERAYYQLGLARQLQAITRKHIDLVGQLSDVVRAKYEVGKAEQHGVLRLQVLSDRLTDDLGDFDQQERELTAAINQVLHRPPETPIATPERFELAQPGHSAKELAALALENRPALKQVASTAAMHRLEADLATAEATPDVTLFAGYGLRTELPSGAGGRDLVTVGVSIPLSLFHKSRYRAESREYRAQARASDARAASLEDAIESGLVEQLATWRRSASKVATYRDKLVPGAQRTLDATRSSYQVDRAQFVSLFDAEVELLDFERAIRRATVAGLISIANIELLIGRELP